MIQKQATAGRCFVEIMNALNHDSSTCCPHLQKTRRSRNSQYLDVGESSSDSTEDDEEECPPNRKRQRGDRNQETSTASTSSVMSTGGCRSGSESNSIAADSSTDALPIRISNVQSGAAAVADAIGASYTQTFQVKVTSSTDEPIYHTINGHRIDLNAASQQNPIRLPNGTTIEVTKVSTPPDVASVQQSLPSTSQAIQPTIGAFHPYLSINPSQALQSFASSSFAFSMPSVDPWLAPRKYANDPLGDACTQFEQQIFNGMEISQNTDTKLKTLMNSNAYKSVRSVNDIKDLIIHMSYLLTYSLGRFKAIQDVCVDDLRKLGFPKEADCLSQGKMVEKSRADPNDANEVEIVEQKHATIDLDDSDDSDDEPTKSNAEATT